MQHVVISCCDKSGLHVTKICGIIGATKKAPENIMLKTLFTLSDVVEFATDVGYVPENLTVTCEQYIKKPT